MFSLNPDTKRLNSLRITVEEQENPEQVFTSFFESFELEDVKAQLKEVMQIVLKKKFWFRPNSIEKDNTKFFFEKLEETVEAAWLMRL